MPEEHPEIIKRLDVINSEIIVIKHDATVARDMASVVKGQVSEIREFLFGNGKIEQSFVYMMRQLMASFDRHEKFHNGVASKSWDIAKQVIIYVIIAVASAIVGHFVLGA